MASGAKKEDVALSVLYPFVELLMYELPNQELSVLYGRPTVNYGEQIFLYNPPYAPRKYDKRIGTPAIV